jgi:hypothetical protein
MDALFGDQNNEDDDDEEEDDDKDDDNDDSIYSGSGTPGSSMRSGSPSARRNNSSTPLVGDGGPVSMMKRMFTNMRKKDTGWAIEDWVSGCRRPLSFMLRTVSQDRNRTDQALPMRIAHGPILSPFKRL